MGEETVKLFDSELKVMDIIWKEGGATAKYVADTLAREIGWNKNTTYTLIKRCIKKGSDPAERTAFYVPGADPKGKGTGSRDKCVDQQAVRWIRG